MKTELIGLSPVESSSNNKTTTNLIDTLMPTLRNYDENGEKLTSFDSFMQELDEEYEKRKTKTTLTRKSSESKKETKVKPKVPLTLDGPINYRDQQNKKKKTKVPVVKPPSPSGSSDDEEEEEEIVYDEDEAW